MASIRSLLLALGTLGLLTIGSQAAAAPVYTCPAASLECEGQTFALWIEDSGSGFFDIAFSIDTSGYDGRADGDAGDYAFGVEFKDIIDPNSIYTGISLLSAPGGIGSWEANTSQLSQDCPDSGKDHEDTGCGRWDAAGAGYLFNVGDTLTWVFHVNTTGAIDFEGGHIKYEYRDVNGKKTAGLLSQDITLQDCTEGACDELPPPVVPEPATLSLVGLGLLGAAARLRTRGRVRK